MTIEFVRSGVTNRDPDWQSIRDITEGKNLGSYLRKIRKPNGAIDDTRTKDYQENAIFYGVAGRTARGLVGTIFRKEPTLNTGALDHIESNIDGSSNGIVQQSRAVCADVLRYGRAGMWVDYADTGGEQSLADAARNFATIHTYKPWQICNWRQERDGSDMRLTLVVLKEYRPAIDGYKVSSEKIYRELSLIEAEDGTVAYAVTVWTQAKIDATSKIEWIIESQAFPTDASGNRLDFIPFAFVGSENNDPKIDDPPMLDLVRVNIGHFRNSADYEDSIFYAGQTQPYLVGATQEYYDLMKEQDFYIGSRRLMPVPEGGSFGFATPDPNPAVRQAMLDKVEQMIGLGASFVERSGAAKTATEADSDERTELSELAIIAGNVSDAYETALAWAALFHGTQPPEYRLSDDFGAITASPAMLTAWVQSWIGGAVPFSDYVAWMRRNGFFRHDKTDDEIQQELEENALGIGDAIDTQ
jgi:hypothetical protein